MFENMRFFYFQVDRCRSNAPSFSKVCLLLKPFVSHFLNSIRGFSLGDKRKYYQSSLVFKENSLTFIKKW